jgi:hypothetical protein
MNDAMLETFTVQNNGSIGQEIRDLNGKIVAWTTDSWVAQVIAQLLSETKNLLFATEEH